MTTPIRRMRRGVSDPPTVAEITRLVDDDHHLVLRIDSDAGGGVTIVKVIAETTVLAEAAAIVDAAAEFRRVATDLMNRLSRKLAIPLESFYRLERLDGFLKRFFGQLFEAEPIGLLEKLAEKLADALGAGVGVHALAEDGGFLDIECWRVFGHQPRRGGCQWIRSTASTLNRRLCLYSVASKGFS